MALLCSKIQDLPYADQLKFIAGKKAANNKIRWVHYLEDPAYVKWLKGGELIIISGLVIKNDKIELIRLIDKLYDYNVAGVIINLSDYIRIIPKEVIQEADELQLPLFEMAAQIRIVDISQSICYAIFQDQQLENQNNNALLEIIYGQRITDRRIERLRNIGIVNGKCYRVLAVKAIPMRMIQLEEQQLYDDNESQQLTNKISTYISNYYGELQKRISFVQDDNILLFYIEEMDYMTTKNEVSFIYQRLKATIGSLLLCIAIGDAFEDIRDLKKCSEMSKNMLDTNIEDGIVDNYGNIIKRLINGYNSVDEITKTVQYVLGDLLKKDNEELLDTIEVYLKNGQNVKNTAEHLYVHTNTIHYRLNKIQKILGICFEEYEKFLQVQVCIEIYKLLKNTK